MADATTTPTNSPTEERGNRRVLTGTVVRDKTDKTRRVNVERLVKHPRYGKFIKKRTVCYIHDEKNESHIGDTVEIMETRPLSKLKCWRLVRIVTKAPTKVQLAETPTA
jgi:small subunit ribosomal protein S17